MPTSTRRSTAPGRRSGPRWRDAAAAAALLLAAACAPRATVVSPDVPRREPALRVGILVDTASVTVSSAAGLEIASAASGGTLARAGAGTPVVFTADAGGRLGYRVGSEPARSTDATLLAVRPAGGAPVSIAGKPYHGIALVRAAGPGRVTAINQVEMEAYLLGVVPQEIGRVGPERFEAAKAQAVAARTYAVKYLGRRSELGFDVYASTQDQVYGGVQAEFDPVSRAVRETAGEILTYRGEPIEAYYHSTCAGRTAAIDEVWNTAPIPYLVSVVDVNPATGQAYDVKSSRFHWTESWSVDSLETILDRTLADSLPAGTTSIGELKDVRVTQRTPSGRVKAMVISTTVGDLTVGGDRVRWILRTPKGALLNSSKFDVEVRRDAAGKPQRVVATGGGWGHGIGMCQVGAMGRAEAGQSYREILGAYFPGTELVRLY
jgi:stage II sporulation protein D